MVEEKEGLGREKEEVVSVEVEEKGARPARVALREKEEKEKSGGAGREEGGRF